MWQAVRNGPAVMPGAVAVEDELGRVISLASFTPEVRPQGFKLIQWSQALTKLPQIPNVHLCHVSAYRPAAGLPRALFNCGLVVTCLVSRVAVQSPQLHIRSMIACIRACCAVRLSTTAKQVSER